MEIETSDSDNSLQADLDEIFSGAAAEEEAAFVSTSVAV
jgi:hypothetical protein